jgi:hypothetical protein
MSRVGVAASWSNFRKRRRMSIALLEAPNRPIFPVQPTKFKLVVNLKAALSTQLAAPAQVWN